MTATLPPFPVDDDMLDRLDHALSEDPEYSLLELRRFFSGYNPDPALDRTIHDDAYGGVSVVEHAGGPLYHPNDIIRALIAEVRRLRGEQP